MPAKDEHLRIFDVDLESFDCLKKGKGFKNDNSISTKSEKLFRLGQIDKPISRQNISRFLKGYNVEDLIIRRLAITFEVDDTEIFELRKLKSASYFPTSDIQKTPQQSFDISTCLQSLKSKFQEELDKETLYYIERTLTTVQDRKRDLSAFPSSEQLTQEKKWNINKILDSGQNFVIIGEPGIGKTTFLLKLALEAIEKRKIPIHIELKGIGKGFKSLKTEILAEIEKFPEGNFLFLLDHLDQTALGFDKSINRLIAERKLLKRNDQFIICCRINYDSSYRNLHRTINLIIEKLSIGEVKDILKHEGIEQLNTRREVNDKLLDFSRNPHQLKLLIKIYKLREDTGRELNITREIEIYNEYVEEHINHEVVKRGEEGISLELKWGALGALALEMQHSQFPGSIERSKVDGIIRKALPGIKEKYKILLEKGDIRKIIKEIKTEGLINLLANREQYVFSHDALKDFFCAWYLANILDKKKALTIIHNKLGGQTRIIDLNWINIIICYAGLVDDIKYLLEILMDEKYAKEDIFHSNLRCAIACLAEVQYNSDEMLHERITARAIEIYLNTEYELLRDLLLRVVGLIRNESVVEKFIHHLKTESKQIQYRAIIALGKLGSDRAVETLIEMLKTEDKKLKIEILNAIGEIKSDKSATQLIEMLETKRIYEPGSFRDDIDQKLESAVNDALTRIGSEKIIHLLLERLNHKDENVQNAAISILGRIGSEEAIEPFAKLWTERDAKPSFYLTIPYALGNIDSDKAVGVLINFLNDGSANAISALGRIGSKKAIEPLESMLKKVEDKYQRFAIAESLRQLGSEKAIPVLESFLSSDDQILQLSAAKELGLMGSEKAIALLVRCLEDKNLHIRERSVKNLLEIGTEQVADFLINSLEKANSRRIPLDAPQLAGGRKAGAPKARSRCFRRRFVVAFQHVRSPNEQSCGLRSQLSSGLDAQVSETPPDR